jgi:hypothetical protein
MGDLIRGQRDVLLQAYAVIESRRQGFASMMWEVPGLAIASQAFLLAGALSPDGVRLFRGAAAILAALVAAAAIQLMTKHRNAEITDSKLLAAIEEELGLAIGVQGEAVPHSRPDLRYTALQRPYSRLDRFASFDVWRSLLIVFLIAGVALGIAIWSGVA